MPDQVILDSIIAVQGYKTGIIVGIKDAIFWKDEGKCTLEELRLILRQAVECLGSLDILQKALESIP